ncbi:hypothetical protein DHW03_02200 [Pedobacter yonginense]|uniref:Fibronectin type-III domain-containing protein n=1 Tax=Pedobacter yonginense TaxID=651869 RepID=A0A317EP74_9SPHI|nr:fibronectin type III domain-containing protein [Pedobacter yonginense]PWS28680.1 hypothetical protein DHW03_02200 [Pedobacter yonginense]
MEQMTRIMMERHEWKLEEFGLDEQSHTIGCKSSKSSLRSFRSWLCFFSLIAISFGFASRTTAQQVSPVLANTQVNPPYSSYLSDYAASGSTKLQVNLFLKDLTKTNYACRLRIKIEGFGITIQSKNDFSVAAILLNGGELSVISGADLEPYLNPQNLVFQGLSQSEFARNGGKLPEGIYRFTVEVIDYYRKSLVSNSALSVVSIFLAYPPIINQPLNQGKVNPLDPQNVVFQWTPRSTGSINSAYNIAYRFRLVEIVPANRDPNDAIRTSKPLYETYTDQTVLVYGLTEPALTPGNSYAVQVQAVEAEGRDLFINNGNSEVVKFTYGDKCASPTNILAELSGMTSIKVSWNADPLQQAFSIRYRESNKPGAQWFEQEVFTPSYLIQGLRSSTKYEFQVKAQCTYGYGDYSELQTFDVPDETLSKGDFVCGKVETLSAEEKGEALPALFRNMIFFAGKFPVVVTEASGSNGKFSGKGTVGVPFLNALSFKVEFKDIRVNIKLKLTDGKVVFARQTLEESIDQVIASITVKPDADGNVDAVSAKGLPTIVDAAMVWPGPLPVYDAKAKTVKFSASVDGGTPKEITIKLKEGQPPLVFQDKNNETFNVDKDGVVKHLGKIPPKELLAGGSSTSYAVNTDKARVDFLAPNQKYGLDAYQPELGGNASYASSYQTLSDEGKGKPKYYVSQKSVESQQAEEIQAKITITDKNLSADRLEFKTASGEKLSATQKDGIYTINIIGALPNNDKEIYAYHPDAAKGGANIGKLNISAFGKISKKVVLIPVNGNESSLSASSIQQRLNKIYSQAVVEWQVELADNFDAQNTAFDDLETANSSVMSAYTNGQKALIKAYRQSHKLENGTYYIFLVKRLSDGSAGYMVRGGQVGFVATSKGDLERTIAHELGHGAFMLQHTWDNPGFKQDQTQNLMDYNGGTELWYSQWKYMRNPDLIFRPFEGDDEGAGASSAMAVQDLFLPYASTDTITLSSGAKVIFKDGVIWKKSSGNNYVITYQGTEIVYKAFKNSITNEFLGFYPIDKLSDSTISNGVKIYGKLVQANYLDKGLYSVIYQYQKEHTKDFFKLLAQRTDITKEQAEQIALLLEAMSPEQFKVFEAQGGSGSNKCGYLDLNIPGVDYSKCWGPLIESLKRFLNGTVKLNTEIIALVKSEKIDKALINEKFSQLKSNNYLGFTASEKQWLLSYLACGNLTSLNNKEDYALKLIENTEETEVDELISVLKLKPLSLNDKQLRAQYSDRILLYTLDKNIDGYNYKLLAAALRNLLLKSSDMEAKLKEVTTNLQERMFVLGVGGQQNFVGQITLADVSWTDGDKLSIVREETIKGEKQVYVSMGSMAGGYYTTEPFNYTNKLAAIELDPFALVAIVNFTNNSEILNAIEMGREPTEGGMVVYAPACFLKFADKKLTNEAVQNRILTTTFIALDVLTFVKGVPAFSAIRTATLAGEIRKELAALRYAYKVLEMGNAVGNIGLNLTSPALQDASFKEIVDASNYLLLAINAKDIVKGTATGLSSVYNASKQALQSGKNLIKKQILARFVAAIIDNEAKLYALRQQANLDAQVARELDQLAAVRQLVEKEGKAAYGEIDWNEAVSSARKGLIAAGSLVFKGDIGKIYAVFINAGYRQERVGDVIKLFSKENKLVAEVSEKSIRFKYQGWGKDIITNSDRTTTCIAKFDDLLDAPGSKWIKYDLPEGSFGRGQLNKGGINILDVDDETFLKLKDRASDLLKNKGIVNPSNNQIITEANEIFWSEYNLPFLEQAFARGDDIRLLSEPQTLFSSIGFYQREIEVINVGWTKPDGTFIQPLKSRYNYKFNDITKTYEKIR